MAKIPRLWVAALLTIFSGGLLFPAAEAATPSCVTTTGPLIPGCSFAQVNGRIEPSISNSPGEPVSSFFVGQKEFGFSSAGDEVMWRGKYVSSAHASGSPGVLRTTAVVSGRHVEDILDRPRVANTFAQATAWYYDRLTINVAGASFGQSAQISGSILARGGYSQVFDNLKGPADGYTLNPRGIFAFDLGASESQSTSIVPGSANDRGRVNLNVQHNQSIPGYHVQHAVHSTATRPIENIVGDPFATPIDFVISFRSGIPFYVQAQANVIVLLQMTSDLFPFKVQPVGSISDLHGVFGDSFYWNGLSDAKVGGVVMPFTVVSASGIDYSTSLAPVPEPQTYALLIAGIFMVGLWSRSRGRSGLESGLALRHFLRNAG